MHPALLTPLLALLHRTANMCSPTVNLSLQTQYWTYVCTKCLSLCVRIRLMYLVLSFVGLCRTVGTSWSLSQLSLDKITQGFSELSEYSLLHKHILHYLQHKQYSQTRVFIIGQLDRAMLEVPQQTSAYNHHFYHAGPQNTLEAACAIDPALSLAPLLLTAANRART